MPSQIECFFISSRDLYYLPAIEFFFLFLLLFRFPRLSSLSSPISCFCSTVDTVALLLFFICTFYVRLTTILTLPFLGSFSFFSALATLDLNPPSSSPSFLLPSRCVLIGRLSCLLAVFPYSPFSACYICPA